MINRLQALHFHKCQDSRSGLDIGIVLNIGTFEDLDSSEKDEVCLWVINQGILEMKTYTANEIGVVVVSSEPLTMQDLVYNAASLYSHLRELEALPKASSRDVALANHQRNDYIRQVEEIMKANGLASGFNMQYLMTCLAAISFY